jgi:hypothetical protein
MVRLFVESVGVLGPGLKGWAATREILAGTAPYSAEEVVLAAPEGLPQAERRRTGKPVRLALSAGIEALAATSRQQDSLATVFTSSAPDGQVIHEICTTLASTDRQVSPTRFHNSVHNAPAGYWSIAQRSQAASTSLCCFDWSFAAGLLEAGSQCMTQNEAVLLVSYDVPYPEPLLSARPTIGILGVALLLSAQASPAAFASIDLRLQTDAPAREPSKMQDAGLEALRTGNPTGRGLPLLQALAGPSNALVTIEYLNGAVLCAEVRRC